MLCLATILCIVLVFMQVSCISAEKSMQSPNRKINGQVTVADGLLYYNVAFMGKQVIANSQLGILVDADTIIGYRDKL